MFIYCIFTQYLVGAPFALITASIRRGMEVISLWLCWGGMEAQVSLTVTFSSSAFFGLLFLIFLLTISLSPFLVKFTQILESFLLDNPHKALVLSVGCASFSSTLFPSTQLSVNMLGYSTLWTASFFGNECLWLTLLVKGVNDCLLDNCQISSLPHDCVA